MSDILVGICVIGLVVVIVVKEVIAYKERIVLSKIQKATNVSELEYIFPQEKREQEPESQLVDLEDIPDIEQ